MKKWQLVFLSLALFGLLCANLHPQYRVAVEGVPLPGSYSAAALRKGTRAAEEAAEEILRFEAKMPSLDRRLRLRFRPADDDVSALSAALLGRVSGVVQADAVSVNGLRLGTVADGQRLCERLRETILSRMPAAAVSGNISGRLELRRVYTRADSSMDDEEMLLLITGLAPVIYLDPNGKLA